MGADELDPEVRELLAEAGDDRGGPDDEGFDLDALRRDYDADAERLGGPVPDGVTWDDVEDPVALRIYGPAQPTSGTLVWIHGGGWAMGGRASHHLVCAHLAAASGLRVVAVEYPLIPEHPFPASLDAAWGAVRWAAAQWPGEALVVGGDSAGGNLAAVCTHRARANGPEIAAQLLAYPMLDARMDTPSFAEFATGFGLDARAIELTWAAYGGDGDLPEVSPARAESLEGLPPALVLTAGHDVLRDEARAYAAALRTAGVPVVNDEVAGAIHGFLRWPARYPAAAEALERLGAYAREAAASG